MQPHLETIMPDPVKRYYVAAPRGVKFATVKEELAASRLIRAKSEGQVLRHLHDVRIPDKDELVDMLVAGVKPEEASDE
jgi:hypothetical protein